MNGDIPVPAAYIKKVGITVPDYDFAKLRLKPLNSTGGTDLYSRNFSWGAGLVGLSGRSGLGAGFGISYNSLVWLKDAANDTITFNPDHSNVTPGFNFGYSRIEPAYWDKDNGRYSYLMVTPSGARVEFQQIGATEYYETVDSSYVQLQVNKNGNPNAPIENLTITVTGTDGTKMEYEWKAGVYLTKEIKDTNGNYITIEHDDYGLLKTVTDTLGRVITVDYDAELYPTTITQDWKTNNGSGSNTTHTYATFSYTNKTITTDFDSSLTIYGPPNGTTIKVLDKLTGANGAYTQFEYNDYGQIWKINNHAIDGHKLNHTSVNLQSPSANQTDVPRFSESRSWVENFNLNTSGIEQEIIVQNTFETNKTFNLPNHTGTGTLITTSMNNHPDNLISKTYVGDSGWNESLPMATETCLTQTCTGTDRKRWTWTEWTQDDTTVSYINNPRIIKSKVGDGEVNSTIRTETDYKMIGTTNVSEFGLVEEVRLYDDTTNTLHKKSLSSYNLNNDYVSNRIIGLPSETQSYGLNQATSQMDLIAKVTYGYDEGDFTDSSLVQNVSPIQHYSSYYSSAMIVGRGNLTSTTVWDTDYPTNTSLAISSSAKYNTAGSVVLSTTPDPNNSNGRTVKINYSDNFNDSVNRDTYAYPKTITDPADKSSTVTYRYDIGANVKAVSPAPNGQTHGLITERKYDSLGRLERNSVFKGTTEYNYTRYEYPTDQIHSKVYSIITDTNNNGVGDSADEVLSESWTDGAGRTLQARTENPNSTGGYSGSLAEYDILGRAKRSTIATEIDGSWAPAGDDAVNGFLWTSAEYDWKGRVTRQINTDGTDELISYDGCGCAGGQITTVQSESVQKIGSYSTEGRRTQKSYADILGRTFKTESLDWDGNVYSSLVNTFNGRDQVTNSRQYAGAVGGNNFQDSTMTYDGHGRISTRHYPIESGNTSWVYNSDSSVQSVTDPRGATTSYGYDSRGLTTNISYAVPTGSNIVVPSAANFTYDDIGNRLTMSDSTGTVSYSYNELSQMTAETRTFTGLTGNFTLAYDYQLSGDVKSVTDPFSSTVSYKNDKIGRLEKVEGTGFANITTYAENVRYRAFGGIKQMNYKTDDNALMTVDYDNRQRIENYKVASSVVNGGYVQNYDYEYFKDSKLKQVDNKITQLHGGFDSDYNYDHQGRLTANYFDEVNVPNGSPTSPYNQSIQYDSYSNMTSRDSFIWGADNHQEFDATYTNNRQDSTTDELLTYDEAGRVTKVNYAPNANPPTKYMTSKFDARGIYIESFNRETSYSGGSISVDKQFTVNQTFDTDGQTTKKVETDYTYSSAQGTNNEVETTFYVNSTVTGKNITELKDNGTKKKTNVYFGGAVMATQEVETTGNKVIWKHADPLAGNRVDTRQDGLTIKNQDFEPLGGVLARTAPTGGEFGFWKDWSTGGNSLDYIEVYLTKIKA